MNIKQKFGWLLVAAAGSGLFSANASAGNCDVGPRTIVGLEIITMFCQRGAIQGTLAGVGAATGVDVDGNPFTALTADLREARTGSGAVAQATGLDSAGVPIGGCTLQDFTRGNGPVQLECPSAVRWSGTISHPDT